MDDDEELGVDDEVVLPPLPARLGPVDKERREKQLEHAPWVEKVGPRYFGVRSTLRIVVTPRARLPPVSPVEPR